MHVRHPEGRVKHGGGLPRQAPHAQAVRPVGKHLHIHDVVVNAQYRPHIAAGGVFLLENQQAIRPDGGIQFLGYIQLGGRAQHAVGIHAAQLALLDFMAVGQFGAHQCHRHQQAFLHIGRAANNLQRLALARIHHAHMQVVAVLVGHTAEHAAHHHARHAAVQGFNAFDSGACHNHVTFKPLRIRRDVRILAQPIQ